MILSWAVACLSFVLTNSDKEFQRVRKKTTVLNISTSVSVRFRSKERETGVKDRATNGESKRMGRGWVFPSFPFPNTLFHFLAFVLFLARSKPQIPFLGLSLLRKLKETFATQATFQPHLPLPNSSLEKWCVLVLARINPWFWEEEGGRGLRFQLSFVQD